MQYGIKQWLFQEKIFGGPGPSSFGRQPRLSEITIEPISGVLPKIQVGIRYKRGDEQRALNAESARIEAPRGVGFLGGVSRSPGDQGIWGSVVSSPSGFQSQAPAANAFQAYFRASEAFQQKQCTTEPIKNLGAWARFGGPVPPWPQPKTATGIKTVGPVMLQSVVLVELPCFSQPCQHNGTCVGYPNNTYSCDCTPQHMGFNCELGTITCVTLYVAFQYLSLVVVCCIFSARQHNASALYAISRPSVRLSVTRMDQSKTVEVKIT